MTWEEQNIIDKEFTDIIRNKLSNDAFWKWIRDWKDPEAIIEEAEEWDTETKKKELSKLRKMI